jgi:hypothetical protein
VKRQEPARRRTPASGLALSRREALLAELLASARGGFPTRCDAGHCSVTGPCGPDDPAEQPT